MEDRAAREEVVAEDTEMTIRGKKTTKTASTHQVIHWKAMI